MTTQTGKWWLAFAATLLLFGLVPSNSFIDLKNRDYLAIVKKYAETLIEHGRDTYGKQQSPLFAATLDKTNLELPGEESMECIRCLKRYEWGIRVDDRTLTGANPMHHENFYQILYALTDITGDNKYKENADRTLNWFFTNCQSPQTGLMPWGEEMFWDFLEDTTNGRTHEFWRPWVLWDQSFEVAERECIQFAHGLWNHQIQDQNTGNFSRHAAYHEHGPGSNSQYPRHGGFYIATWAKAFRETQDQEFLKAINTLIGFYDRNRSKESGAIPAEIGQERSRGNLMWPHSNLSLAIDLWEAAQMVPEDLAARMREMAVQIDKIYLKLNHHPEIDGEGFVTQANVHILIAEDVRQICRRVYSDPWIAGYGHQVHAQVANQCMVRYRQNQNEGYRKLILKSADYYLNHEISYEFPVYPGTIGQVIWLMLNSYELTENPMYLERAEYFAGKAVELFLSDESGLPSGSSEHHHYEAITRGDTLMMSLLRLWNVLNQSLDLNLKWCDR